MSEEQTTYQCSLSAQELRVGNWVYDGERTQFPMQVVAIGKDWAHLDFPGNEGGVWEADIKDLRAIPITKEILKKAGFCWEGCYERKELDDVKVMQYYKHESRLRVWYKTEEIIFECHGVRHLHQLQNAYYMATGEELQIDMAVTFIKEKKLRTPVFYAKCPCCGTEFTYEGEDVVSAVESQTEGAAYGVKCPRCNYPFWADRKIYTYLLK